MKKSFNPLLNFKDVHIINSYRFSSKDILPTDGLVIYNKFDGDVLDYSGNGKDWTSQGTAVYSDDRNSVPSSSLDNTGTTFYLTQNAFYSPLLGAMETLLWFKTGSTVTTTQDIWFELGTNTNNAIGLRIQSGNLRYFFRDETGGGISSVIVQSLTVDTYYFVSMGRDDLGNTFVYVDDVVTPAITGTSANNVDTDNVASCLAATSGIGRFLGKIDNFYSYSRKLTDAERLLVKNNN